MSKLTREFAGDRTVTDRQTNPGGWEEGNKKHGRVLPPEVVRGDYVTSGVESNLPRQWALRVVRVVVLVAVDMFVLCTDIQLSKGITDLHIQIKVST